MRAILIVGVVGFLAGGDGAAEAVETCAKARDGGRRGKRRKVGGHFDVYLPRRLSVLSGGALVEEGYD